jgi:hypothetical protein
VVSFFCGEFFSNWNMVEMNCLRGILKGKKVENMAKKAISEMEFEVSEMEFEVSEMEFEVSEMEFEVSEGG